MTMKLMAMPPLPGDKKCGNQIPVQFKNNGGSAGKKDCRQPELGQKRRRADAAERQGRWCSSRGGLMSGMPPQLAMMMRPGMVASSAGFPGRMGRDGRWRAHGPPSQGGMQQAVL
jgi:hypothetical protein